MDAKQEIIIQERPVPMQTVVIENEMALPTWIFDRVKTYITGNSVEIDEAEGIIAPLQINHNIKALSLPLDDSSFKDHYPELEASFDTLIVLNESLRLNDDKSILAHSHFLLKKGGFLIIRLCPHTALFRGLDQGYKHWKHYNEQYSFKLLRKDYSIVKTRYFQVISQDTSLEMISTKYSERVSIFIDPLYAQRFPGLSMLIAGQKR